MYLYLSLVKKSFFPKKRQKTAFFGGHDSGVSSLWEDLCAKLLGLGQLLGRPWKDWDITVQTSYWEGLWHQNCGYTSLILFFAGGHGNQWKTELFRNLLWNPYALRIQKMYMIMKGGYNKCLCHGYHWSTTTKHPAVPLAVSLWGDLVGEASWTLCFSAYLIK